jgi:hypothetical protein
MTIKKNISTPGQTDQPDFVSQQRSTDKKQFHSRKFELTISNLIELVENNRRFRKYSIDDNGGGYQGL